MFSLVQALAPILVFVVMAGSGAPSNAAVSKARDAQRRADVNIILNAVYQYAIDNNGELPAGIPSGQAKEVCSNNSPVQPCVDLRVLTKDYLVAIPTDPQAPDGHTWYTIVKSGENRITVQALHPENQPINVTR